LYNFFTILPRRLPDEGPQIFLQLFHNFSTLLPCFEEFGASGLARKRIVEGIIVEKLWKHLVNAAAPAVELYSPPGFEGSVHNCVHFVFVNFLFVSAFVAVTLFLGIVALGMELTHCYTSITSRGSSVGVVLH
jgi:hypothetical protein